MSVQRFLLTTLLFIALILPANVPAALARQPAPGTPEGGAWLAPRLEFNSTIGPTAWMPQPASVDQFGPTGLAPTPGQDTPMSGAVQTADGLWMMPADAAARAARPETALASGGPDGFGYTFNSVPLNWIDASGGTDTGINASVFSAGPIDIGFPFKYYENTYSQLWVSRHGFLAFNGVSLSRGLSRIPDPSLPNDVIAPHWIESSDSPNYVRYRRGGAAPNRWFVMEWNRQRSNCCTPDPAVDEFTFQVVLYENGDILFQYQGMHIYGRFYCQASGIEDSDGVDGLSITNYCSPVAGNQAVRITRPAPAARVRIPPLPYNTFAYPGGVSQTEIPIHNTGELGTDTYDLALNTSWAASLFHADGVTPLSDTDGDGVVDTGPVAQGATKIVVIKVWSSASAQVGDTDIATLTARSSLDSNVQKTVTARIVVPAPFVQIYRDIDIAGDAVNMMLVQPQAQAVRNITNVGRWSDHLAVAELPNHNLIYVWNKFRCSDDNCTHQFHEIEYTILDPYGETVRPVTRLVDHSGATVHTTDYITGVAVAPDGRIGLVWYRYLWRSNAPQNNFNIYWAVLHPNGDLAAGPVNITNNSVWSAYGDLNAPRFYNPVIASTGDNRFILSWVREVRESAGQVIDIFYTARDANDSVVKGITKLTNASAGGAEHYKPAVASLSSNRVFLSWTRQSEDNSDLFYVILGSDGAQVKPIANLSTDGMGVSANRDAVQLPDGKIMAVWEAGGCFPGEQGPRIRYALLDASYNRIGAPKCLDTTEVATTGDMTVSVTAGGNHLAVLTWADWDLDSRRNLYYALVDSNGVVLTPPMILQTSQADRPSIRTSFYGYGNTTYSWTPPAGVDSALAATPSLAPASPGGSALPITVELKGRGGTPATSVRLTAALDPRLSYVSDTSGVTPTVSGQTVTWNLPNLRLFDNRQFQINLQTTASILGELLPVQLQLASAEPDLTPADNQATVQVWISQPLYLPLMVRQ